MGQNHPLKKVGVHRHFQASWASQLMGCLLLVYILCDMLCPSLQRVCRSAVNGLMCSCWWMKDSSTNLHVYSHFPWLPTVNHDQHEVQCWPIRCSSLNLTLSPLSSHSMGSPDPQLLDATLFLTVFLKFLIRYFVFTGINQRLVFRPCGNL